jgi:NAD-dependent SIR2 family protein deacetylase
MADVDELGFDIQLDDNKKIERAAKAIADAEFIVFAAGAGFSADSGLAVYKDVAKFPAYEKLDLDYADLCRPTWLEKDPSIFYGFWGKCYNDYQDVKPHEGYEILLKIKKNLFDQKKTYSYKTAEGDEKTIELNQSFVYTSNVDGFFIKAGFKEAEVYEIHGTCDFWQCNKGTACKSNRWKLPNDFRFHVDMETMKAKEISDHPLKNRPTCPKCNGMARPNVLMFCDCTYEDEFENDNIYREWKRNIDKIMREHPDKKLVVIECGAGITVPTVRYQSESLISDSKNATLIRINPDFPSIKDGNLRPRCISFQARALDTLRDIYDQLQTLHGGATNEIEKEYIYR